jgi:hypothetical protein
VAVIVGNVAEPGEPKFVCLAPALKAVFLPVTCICICQPVAAAFALEIEIDCKEESRTPTMSKEVARLRISEFYLQLQGIQSVRK